MQAIADGLGERVWCAIHPFSLTDDERLNFSWDEFAYLLKHRRRYFFLNDEHSGGELLSPVDLLHELAGWCERFGLVKKLSAGTVLYRTRRQEPGEILSSAVDLGPPPEERAIISNRMSPPGIVMFYVSEDPETALRETVRKPGRFVVGVFRTKRDVKILDLSDMPEVPSIFDGIPDSMEYDPRPAAMFLSYFADELSKPIDRPLRDAGRHSRREASGRRPGIESRRRAVDRADGHETARCHGR
jgi:hypothetical protein